MAAGVQNSIASEAGESTDSGSVDAHGLRLGLQREFNRQKGVILRHGFFGAVQAIENELAEVRKSHLAVHREMVLTFGVHQIDVIAFRVARDVEILAEFEVTVRSHDQRAAVAPRAEACGCVPIHSQVLSRAVVGDERGIAEVLEVCMLRPVIIGHLAVQHARGFCAGKVQELFDLMAANVHQDAAVLLALPVAPGAQPVSRSLAVAVTFLDRTINFWSIIILGLLLYLVSKRK